MKSKKYAALVYRCSKLIYQLKTEIKITISFRGIHIKTKRYKTGYIDEVSVSFKTIYRHANLHSANKFLFKYFGIQYHDFFSNDVNSKNVVFTEIFFLTCKGMYMYIIKHNNETVLLLYIQY